eukprot:Colp12_sorted_trinity150504_noHs@35889
MSGIMSLEESAGFQNQANEFVSWYKALQPAQWQFLLDRIAESSSRQQLSYIHSKLSDNLRVDFLSALPPKLAKHVLSFCDAKSLGAAAQVSKHWKELADDDSIWHRMCAQHINRKCTKCGWGLPLTLDPAKDECQRNKRRERRWKDIYCERLRVERNWRQGLYTERVMEGHTEGVLCLQFDDHNVISGAQDKTIRVWDIKTGQCLSVLEGHESSVRSLQFDSVKIISGGMDGSIKIWDRSSGQCVRTLLGHTAGVLSVQFDDEKLVSGSADSTIRVWRFSDKGENPILLLGHTDSVNCAKVHGNTVISCSDDGTIRIWDTTMASCTMELKGHLSEVQSIQVSHHSIVSGSLDNTVKVWDLETGECLKTLFGHTDGVACVQCDNLRVVSSCYDETIKIWDRDSGECIYTLDGHTGPVNCVQFNDKMIITGSDDTTIRVWDFTGCHNRNKRRRIEGH